MEASTDRQNKVQAVTSPHCFPHVAEVNSTTDLLIVSSIFALIVNIKFLFSGFCCRFNDYSFNRSVFPLQEKMIFTS